MISKEVIDVLKISLCDINENIQGNEVIEEIRVLLQKDIYNFAELREGNKVKITGIIKSVPTEKNGRTRTILEKVMYGYGLEKLDDNFSLTEISAEDREKFEEISKNPIEFISKRIFKDVIGSDLQKDILTVALASDVNCLLLGDPGTGKSLMAKRCVKTSLRGKHADCLNSSASGIIGTVSKNEFTGRYTLDSGVFRPCHPGGLVALDEINRDGEFVIQKVIMEIMNSRRLNINKANTRVDEECDVSIWASANPLSKGRNKNLPGIFNILEPTWDRFDLKIFFNDKPDLNDLCLINKLVSDNADDFKIDEDIVLIKKYLLDSMKIKMSLTLDDLNLLSKEAKIILPKISGDSASFRTLKVFKKLVEGMCRIHHVTAPKVEFYTFLNDILLKIESEKQKFLYNLGE